MNGINITNSEQFKNYLKNLRDTFHNVKTSVVGVATSVYPIHLLSNHEIPKNLFRETDEIDFRVRHQTTERGGHYFTIYPLGSPETEFYFTVPEVILSKYRDSIKRFKIEFLEWIDVPITFGSIRRILRFKLDLEGLRSN